MIEKIIYIHVHIAGPGDIYKDDLYLSEKFKEGIRFIALKILLQN